MPCTVFSLALDHQDTIYGNWYYFVGATGTAAFEEQLDNSFGGAFRAGAGYEFTPNFRLHGGAALFINYVRSTVLPFFNLSYSNYADDGSGYYLTLGLPFNEAGYVFSDLITVRANFSRDSKFYRLKDDSTVYEKGYVDMSGYRVGLFADIKPFSGFLITAGPTFDFDRRLTLYDHDKDKKNKVDIDSGIGFILNFRYKF